jgi:hypothetical protein
MISLSIYKDIKDDYSDQNESNNSLNDEYVNKFLIK